MQSYVNIKLHVSTLYKRNVIENKFVNSKLEKGGGDKSVPRAPVICADVISFVYICSVVGDPVVKLTGLTTPPSCVCPKPRS